MKKNFQTVSLNLSEDYAIKALSKLSNLGLDPTPDLYSIWYTYYKGGDCDLVNKIDKILADNPSGIEEFHFTSVFGYNKKENVALNEFAEDSINIIEKTYDNANAISENTRRLGRFIHETSNDTSKQTQDIIKDIQNETENIILENERLSGLIQSERLKIEELKIHLEKIKRELITDSLTGVHNRRHFDDCLQRAIKETNIANKPLSLFIFDIDHFKKFNDTHGHVVGDTVLKFVGNTMKATLPEKAHHMFRYGGEEFAVIFDGINKGDAMKYSAMLSNAISKREITKKSTNEKIGNITVSGGIAEKNKRDTPQILISRSDVALYESKNKGRNQISFAA
jgi:diguanylate cyclase